MGLLLEYPRSRDKLCCVRRHPWSRTRPPAADTCKRFARTLLVGSSAARPSHTEHPIMTHFKIIPYGILGRLPYSERQHAQP